MTGFDYQTTVMKRANTHRDRAFDWLESAEMQPSTTDDQDLQIAIAHALLAIEAQLDYLSTVVDSR